MHAWWLLALPFIAGSLMPLQAGINGQVARHLSSVMAAALLSFSVGTLALLCVVLAQRGLPSVAALRELSGYHWLGGLFGAVFIAVAAFAAPRIGGLVMMVLILAGQLGMALLLDHFGWVGYREAPVSAGKVGGLALIVAGIWLIQRG